MSKPEVDSVLNQWLAGDISDEEFAKAKSKEELLKYQQILNEVDIWTPDNQETVFVLPEAKKPAKVIKLTRWSAISVAASVTLIAFMSLWFLRGSDEIKHLSAFGETKEITLPDGLSSVILAANSAISWKVSDWEDNQRKIELSGKAYFDVEPGSTFSVTTSNGDVEVLGTTFDVNIYETALQVICYSGSVKAKANDRSNKILLGGQSIRYFDGLWEEKMIISDTMPAWVSTEFKFSNAPLSEVLASLSSQHAINFDKEAINQKRRFSGFLPKEDLDTSLNILFTTLGIAYDQKGKTIILKNQ